MQGPGVAASLGRSERLARVALVLATIAAPVLLSACGGGDSGGTETNAQQAANGGSAGSGSGGGAGGAGGHGGLVGAIESAFPEPTPQPNSPPGAQRAIDAGRKACTGKTPVQVRDEFMAEAEASGLLNPGQEKMVADIARYEKQATTADFVAGQLGAGVYEATLPEELRTAGYQGCVYELAQQLLKEIAQK